MAGLTENPAAGLLNLEKELVCFICTEVLYQPLSLNCMHTFCGSCLKEWFSHQHRKATHSHTPPTHPYTCPTCRAPVKDVQRNAMINTILEMFVAANPGKDRTVAEKAEMAQVYKPGEDIMPRVESHRRRERRRREEEELAIRERQAVGDGMSESSRRDQRLDPASAHSRRHTAESSRSRERRERQRSETGQSRHDASDSESTRSRPTGSSNSAEFTSLSAPPSSPRHPDAVEARQRGARTVAHQASLISLVSASESGTGTGHSLNEAQLMQEILDAGLLDGINVDELTEQEQDELSEIIAQRYRELHAERIRLAETERSRNDSSGDTVQPTGTDRRQQRASRDVDRERLPTSPRTAHSIVIGGNEARAPTSFPQSSADQALNVPQSTSHRRRASNESRRSDHSASLPHAAGRSVTDLSDRPHSQSSVADRPQQQPHAHRSNTEPRTSPRASEVWQAAISRPISSQTTIDLPRQNLTRVDSPQIVMSGVTSGPVPTSIPTSVPSTPVPEPRAINNSSISEEPHVSCARCSRPDIQYEVYKHCEPCNMDLCLRCYRSGRGCNHWFGFGHAAMRKFEASRPQSRNSQAMEFPHLLVGRQYKRQSSNLEQGGRGMIEPATSILREGNFCDLCGTFANDYFWTCDVCNDGEWGFCNDCVNTNHCCDHPLLPVAHRSLAPNNLNSDLNGRTVQPSGATLSPHRFRGRDSSPAHSVSSSATSAAGLTSGLRTDSVPLVITTNCDICSRAISPDQARYHCPTHPTPSAENPNQQGDYDICSNCYKHVVKSGQVKREDGPDGWRLCPDGHRMISIAFEQDAEGGQRRVIVRDIVGGVKMSHADMLAWKQAMNTIHRVDPNALSSFRGDWQWHEDEAGTRRGTRSRTTTLPYSGAKFPPDGGSGKVCRARWSYYPPEGDERSQDELMFPKFADVREIEEINDEWWLGVYAGKAGLFPAIFVQ